MVAVVCITICVIIILIYALTKEKRASKESEAVEAIIKSLPISIRKLELETRLSHDALLLYLNIYGRLGVAIKEGKSRFYKDKILSELPNRKEWENVLDSIARARVRKYYIDMVQFCSEKIDKELPKDVDVPRIKYMIRRIAFILIMTNSDVNNTEIFSSALLAILNNDKQYLNKEINMTYDDAENYFRESLESFKDEFDMMKELPNNILSYGFIASLLLPHFDGKRKPLESMMIVNGIINDISEYLKNYSHPKL